MTVSIRYPKGLWPQAGTDYSAVHWKMQVPRRSLVVIVDGRQLRPINVLSSWHGLRLDSDCLRKCHASAECPNRLPMKAQKVEMSLSYIRKGCHRGFFFSPRAEVFPRAVFTPEGRLYALAKRGQYLRPKGVKTAQGYTFAWGEKKIQGDIDFAMEDVTFFHFGGNSHAEWMFQWPKKAKKGQKRPKRPKKPKHSF